MAGFKIPVGISNRHVHLCQSDIEQLFGKDYKLTKIKDLNDGEYACEEKVDVEGTKGIIEGIRIVGPVRRYSQVELSLTDAKLIGINAPIRESGDVEGSAGAILAGPSGKSELKQGVIASARHIHISDVIANDLGISDGDYVSVRTCGIRSVIFNNVLVKVDQKSKLELHIDWDEANAAGLSNGDTAEII